LFPPFVGNHEVGNHAPVHHAVAEDAGVVGTVQNTTVVPHHDVPERPDVPVHVVSTGRVREQEVDGSGGLF
jgi:hypothetical protein